MLHGLHSLLGDGLGEAVTDRVVLLLNHVIAAEPVAVARLRPHAGRVVRLQLEGRPAWLASAAPDVVLRVTPAGLFERCARGVGVEPALHVKLAAANPALGLAQALAGQRPRVEVAGDAAFAADLQWLVDNLRWDVEDDLARLVGPLAARRMARVGAAVALAIRQATTTLGGLAAGR